MDSISVLARNLSFLGTRLDTTIFRYSHGFYHFRYSYGQFFGTRTESFFSGNSPGYYNFSILARILPFSALIWTVFRYSHGIFLFRELAWIQPYFDTRTDCTIFGTPMTVFRYSHGIFLFRELARILRFSVLIWTVFRYSHGIFLFRELARIPQFSVLARILPFVDAHSHSTIFRYSYGQFFGTRTESFFSGNSPGYSHFSILAWILPFSVLL